jgi:hypothetical protein
MPNEECKCGPNQAVFFILHPAFFIQAAFFGRLPVKLRLKPSSEERGGPFEAQLHWE